MDSEKTRRTFEVYARALRTQDAISFNAGLVEEVRSRLEQLYIVLTKIQALDKERVQYVTRPNSVGLDGTFLHSTMFEVRMFTEAFYYFAGRLRSILRSKDQSCPFWDSFECPGIRDVRNKLIEHSEGSDSRAFTWSWAVGGPDGPVLEVHREADEESAPSDRGLNVNAQELCDNLDAKLAEALRQLSGRGDR